MVNRRLRQEVHLGLTIMLSNAQNKPLGGLHNV